jgi:TnpA family transposase
MPYSERLQILTEAEQADLYSPPKFSIEEQRLYFNLNDIERIECETIRRRDHKCYFIALLGYFKSKPVMLDASFSQISADLTFIATEGLKGKGLRPFSISQKLKDRLYLKVLALLDHQKWQQNKHFNVTVTYLVSVGHSWLEPRYLFDAAIDYHAQNQIAIPKYTVMQQLVSQAMQHVRNDIEKTLQCYLNNELKDFLNAVIHGNDELSLRHLREGAKSFKAYELKKERVIYQQLSPWGSKIHYAVTSLGLSIKNQQHFADMVGYYGAKLKRFKPTRQYLWLLCHLNERAQLSLERLADGFIYHIRKQQDSAKTFAQEAVYSSWQSAAENVTTAAELLHLFVDKSIEGDKPFSAVRQQALKLMTARDIETLCLYLKKQKRAVEEYQWQYYDEQQHLIENTLRPIFLCLNYQAAEGSEALVAQLNITQHELAENQLLRTVEQSLIPKRHFPWLVNNGEVNAKRYEWLLYRQLVTRLNGRIYVSNVTKYRALEDDLIDADSQQEILEQSTLTALKAPVNDMLSQKLSCLGKSLEDVAQHIDEGDNRNVIMKNRKGTRWRLPIKGVKSLVNNPFFKKMRQIDIADVLRYVAQETCFMECFEHVLPIQKQNSFDQDDILAILIANGTHRGVYGMAQISDRTYDHLNDIQANYIRPETLHNACDMINNALAQTPIFAHYHIQEDIVHASADGQKHETRRETFKTRYSSKYFGANKGLTAMSLIANHGALNACIIGSNEHESHYIYDLLQSNTSDIKPNMLSTDTHGVNHVNYALLDLSGYTFAPRYAQFSTVINDMFDVTEDDQGQTTMTLKKPIRYDIIEKGWQDIQRIMLSLQSKRTTQASLVRKLSGYPAYHPTLQALTEYNRLIKAQYLLDYIDDASLRQYVQRALNRGEAWHALRRTIALVNGNKFRGKNESEIELWNECARLIANAIVYFNSMVLSHLLIHYEETGDEEKTTIIKQVSPVAWENMNLSGSYSFASTGKLLDMQELTKPIVDDE